MPPSRSMPLLQLGMSVLFTIVVPVASVARRAGPLRPPVGNGPLVITSFTTVAPLVPASSRARTADAAADGHSPRIRPPARPGWQPADSR